MRAALRMSSGPALWALHFAAVYGFTALACARGFGGAAPWAVGLATLVAAAAALFILARNLHGEFTRWIAAGLAAAALVAILYEGLPALMVPACA